MKWRALSAGRRLPPELHDGLAPGVGGRETVAK